MGRVDQLIQQLESGNREQRVQAAEALGRLGNRKAVPALIKTLNNYNEDYRVRAAAISSIGQLGDFNAIPDLLDAYRFGAHFPVVGVDYRMIGGVSDESIRAYLRERTIRAIGEILGRTSPKKNKNQEIYSRTVDTLIQALKEDWETDGRVRAAAAKALGKTRDPKAIPALTELLDRGRNFGEREQAAIALGQIGDPQAVPALLRRLGNGLEDYAVRIAAARSIGQVGGLEVVPKLFQVYQDTGSEIREAIVDAVGEILSRTSPDDDNSREIYSRAVNKIIQDLKSARTEDEVRVAAAKALAKIRHPQVVDILIPIMEDPYADSYAPTDDFVRAEVARVLGSIGDPKAIDPLIRTLENASSEYARELGKAIVETLGAFPDSRVTDALVKALAYDLEIARPAAELLKKLRDRRAVEPLIRILDSKESSERTRELAVDILAAMGEPRVIPALIKALRDNDEDVRKAAFKSLQRFILTHPDAILRTPPEDRHLLGRQIQDAQRNELLKKLCSKSRRKTR